ncbi:MAG TPA: methyltransferase domain-containing protein [Solirubrobacteraceae bacterium]|nr:methyltransferase domain-containing protein [Solirubrobacteraceae bacterium]
MSTAGDPGYALSSSNEDEHERLVRQADMYAPFTRRLLARAGIEPGMRVLDVGCGPGDVSLLLSELVGADGSVVGVERDEQALARARRRADESELHNIEFVCGDFREVELAGGPFDALVWRLVLMYQGDPPAAVRAAARQVRPGGVVVFAEMCMRTGSAIPQRFLVSWPHTPASERLSEWIDGAFGGLGTQPDMGMRLPETLRKPAYSPAWTSTAKSRLLLARRRSPRPWTSPAACCLESWLLGWPPKRKWTSTLSPSACVPTPDRSDASRSGRQS